MNHQEKMLNMQKEENKKRRCYIVTYQRETPAAGAFLAALAGGGARDLLRTLFAAQRPAPPALLLQFALGRRGAALKYAAFPQLAGREENDLKRWTAALEKMPKMARFMGFDPDRPNLSERMRRVHDLFLGNTPVEPDAGELARALSDPELSCVCQGLELSLEPSPELAKLMEREGLAELSFLMGQLAQLPGGFTDYGALAGAPGDCRKAAGTLFFATGAEYSAGQFRAPDERSFLWNGPVFLLGSRSHLFTGGVLEKLTPEALGAGEEECLEVFDRAQCFLNLIQDCAEKLSLDGMVSPSELDQERLILPSPAGTGGWYASVYRPAVLRAVETLLLRTRETQEERAAARSADMAKLLSECLKVRALELAEDRSRYDRYLQRMTWEELDRALLETPADELMGPDGGIGARRHGKQFRYPVAVTVAMASYALLQETLTCDWEKAAPRSFFPLAGHDRVRWLIRRRAAMMAADDTIVNLDGNPIVSRRHVVFGLKRVKQYRAEGMQPSVQAFFDACCCILSCDFDGNGN